jgi:hypothetical protein
LQIIARKIYERRARSRTSISTRDMKCSAAMKSDTVRERARVLLRKYIERHGLPRATMTVVVLLTGTAGFLCSFALLRVGLEKMWIRYPLSVAVAYIVFLALLRLWVAWQREFPDVTGLDADAQPEKRLAIWSESSDRRWTEWLDGAIDHVPDLDLEGCLFGVIALAVTAVAAASAYVIWIAPELLAELVLDALVMAVISKRMKAHSVQHWLTGVIRRTLWPCIGIAVLFAIAGYAMQLAEPDARSFGSFFRYHEARKR